MRYHSVNTDYLFQMLFTICMGNFSKILPLYWLL